MHVIARRTLLEYCKLYPDAKDQLLAWYGDAKSAEWRRPTDIQAIYGNRVDFPGDKRVVFDIKGTGYRLVVIVEYQFMKVFIRWFGKHEEYDKINVMKV